MLFSLPLPANIDLQTNIEVQSFSYKRLTLAYGPNKCYSVSKQASGFLITADSYCNSYDKDPIALEWSGLTYLRCFLCFQVLIQYRQSDQQFHLAFGTRRQCSLANCHILVAKHLQKDLNSSKSIAQLAQVRLFVLRFCLCLSLTVAVSNALCFVDLQLSALSPFSKFFFSLAVHV